MSGMTAFVLRDVIRSRFVLAYGILTFAMCELLVRFVGIDRVYPTLITVMVPLAPLVSIVFGLTYTYRALSFAGVLIAQPVSRASVFRGLLAGMAVPVSVVPSVAMAVPLALRGGADLAALGMLMLLVAFLALAFVFLGCWIAVRVDDRVAALTASLFLWVLLAIVYDGIILVAAQTFSDYPLERPLLVAMMLNPLDLARVALLTVTDLAMLQGYTGAVFVRFFGSTAGVFIATAAMLVWVVIPGFFARRRFLSRDF